MYVYEVQESLQEIYNETVKLYNRLREIGKELEKDKPNISNKMLNDLLSDAQYYRDSMIMLNERFTRYNGGAISDREMSEIICCKLKEMSTIIMYFNPDNEGYPEELKK